MDYPAHDKYAVLYARYLTMERTRQMLDLCGTLAGKYVLDLCGGGGRASREALARGAAGALLVDESLPMCRNASDDTLHVLNADLESSLEGPLTTAIKEQGGVPFDVAICQQAINYWFDADLIGLLRQQLKPGASFVFNTFNEPPPHFPVPKTYEFEGRQYIELSWRTSEHHVEHVQVCEGLPTHTTRFRWISPDEYKSVLAPHFITKEIREGRTSIWRCVAH
jgi:SAM-dependent methyltransferase